MANQMQSDAIRCNQMQSDAIRCYQAHSPPNTAMSERPRRTAVCRERGAGGTPCTSGWPTCGETERRGERGCHWAACVHQRLAYLKRRRHPHARRHRRRARRAVATDQLQPIQRRRGHSLMGATEEEHLHAMREAISMQSACNQHAISMGATEEEHLHAMREAISMQSACSQHGSHRRGAPACNEGGNQHAISMGATEEEHLGIVYGHRARTQPRGRRCGPGSEVNRWQTP
jgi:hypothetical protein